MSPISLLRGLGVVDPEYETSKSPLLDPEVRAASVYVIFRSEFSIVNELRKVCRGVFWDVDRE